MANEFSFQGSLSVNNPTTGIVDKFPLSSSIQANQTGKNLISETMAVTTGYAQVPLGAIGTTGPMMFKNMDATNTVVLKAGAGGSDTITIPPGETSGPFRFVAASPPYAKTVASTAQLFCWIAEN